VTERIGDNPRRKRLHAAVVLRKQKARDVQQNDRQNQEYRRARKNDSSQAAAAWCFRLPGRAFQK
jgi:hypothetical protein